MYKIVDLHLSTYVNKGHSFNPVASKIKYQSYPDMDY